MLTRKAEEKLKEQTIDTSKFRTVKEKLKFAKERRRQTRANSSRYRETKSRNQYVVGFCIKKCSLKGTECCESCVRFSNLKVA